MKDILLNKLSKSSDKATKEIGKNFKFLENHIIQVQENQVEFEKYLKDIKSTTERLEAKINSLDEFLSIKFEQK